MICVTGSETDIAELRERLSRHAEADLQEVRIDLFDGPFSSDFDLDTDPQRLLLTCRPEREGGGFTGSEHDRLELLEGLVKRLRPAWIDVESSSPEDRRARIIETARSSGTKVLISRHELRTGASSRALKLAAELAELGGDAIKLAVAVEDAAELVALREAARNSSLPAVVLGMGPAGLLSRALYNRFDSIFTYAAADVGRATAPGQLSAQTFRDWQLPLDDTTPIYVLLGGSQVMDSPGPRVYNRLFARREIDACYLPVVTDRPDETMSLLLDLGLRGASVTMPLKERVQGLLHELSVEARTSGVVNTISLVGDGELRGDLTDGDGAVAALEQFCQSVGGRQVVVLGTGGAAAAIARSLHIARAQVTVLGRNVERAELLATRLAVHAGALEDLASTPFDLLVNATPVGEGDPDASLVDDPSLLKGKVVLDVVHGERTRLLRETEAAGGQPITGRSMWAEQGVRQLRRWLSIDVTAVELEQD
ncbi:MAG: type I 3-dehydroquinate dehydratase [Deltaproteobacteria bacterium]|nr:type I 3-dehydroquinate dehydratase [Deltaproteobacteria bacterium]